MNDDIEQIFSIEDYLDWQTPEKSTDLEPINNVEVPVTLDTPMTEVEQRIIEENDIDELKNIVDIFNLNIQKKNLIRNSKLVELQDLITNQMEQRITKRADEFSNQDLLTYFKTVQETISKSDNTLDNVNTPAIRVIQNQLNINVDNQDTLPRESKERVVEAIKAIFNKAETVEASNQEDIIDADFIEEEVNDFEI